jgi:ribosomal protein L7/L12
MFTRTEFQVLKKLVQSAMDMGAIASQGVGYSALLSKIEDLSPTHSRGTWNFNRGDFTFSFFYGSNKVSAIKAIRQVTGLGLKDAKDIADQSVPISNGMNQIVFSGTTTAVFDEFIVACNDYAINDGLYTNDGLYVRANIKGILK